MRPAPAPTATVANSTLVDASDTSSESKKQKKNDLEVQLEEKGQVKAGSGEIESQTFLVLAKSAYAARKPTQMSFGKGDTIEVSDTTGRWWKGVLTASTTQPITGTRLNFPSNFVKKI